LPRIPKLYCAYGLSDNPNQQSQIPILGRVVDQKIQSAETVIALRRSQGFAAAADSINEGQDRGTMDELQGVLHGLGSEELPLLVVRDADAQRRSAQSKAVVIFGTLLGVFLAAASWTVQRDSSRRGVAEDRRKLEQIMNNQVLSTSRYPDVVYRSADARALKLGEGLYRVDLTGQLTLNGATRTQNVTSQVSIGSNGFRAIGNFEIRQSDFGIAPAKVAGGLLTLRDELKFAFFILARQDGAAADSRGVVASIGQRG